VTEERVIASYRTEAWGWAWASGAPGAGRALGQHVVDQTGLGDHGVDAILAARDRHRDGAWLVRQFGDAIPVDLIGVRGDALAQFGIHHAGKQAFAIQAQTAGIVFHDRIGLQIQGPIAPAEDIRLIDDRDLGADGYQVVEDRDVLGVEAHAAMAGTHAHAVRLVRAVNQIARPT
jgi:hypothetical protein